MIILNSYQLIHPPPGNAEAYLFPLLGQLGIEGQFIVFIQMHAAVAHHDGLPGAGVEAAVAGGFDCAAMGDAKSNPAAKYHLDTFGDLLDIA